jgi:hypothetical protein
MRVPSGESDAVIGNRNRQFGGGAMDNEQFSKWFLAVSIQLNRVLKLMPQMAWERDLNMLLAQYGGDKILQIASTLGPVDTEKIKLMVEQYPDLGNQLASEDAQQAIQNWVSASKLAPRLNTLRLMAAWVTPPAEKTGNSQLEWQIEDMPDDGGIYRTMLRGETG